MEGKDGGERDARVAAATAQVQQAPCAGGADRRRRREAVEDVAEGDPTRVRDRGQVDRGIPGEQEPGVVVDQASLPPRQPEPHLFQPSVEVGVVLGGEWREIVGTRRERGSLTDGSDP